MQCKNHPGENGVNTCNQCGSWLCESCTFERNGRMFCHNCVAPVEATSHSSVPAYSRQNVSWGLLFLFSVVIMIPGLNYMYMGLIKRGLLAMIAFFGTIYMGIQLSMNGFGFGIIFFLAIPIIICVSIFDGFRIRRRINAGEVITDNVDDIIAFVRRYRSVIVGLLLVLVAINIFGSIAPGIIRVLRNLVPIMLVLWVILTVFDKPKKK